MEAFIKKLQENLMHVYSLGAINYQILPLLVRFRRTFGVSVIAVHKWPTIYIKIGILRMHVSTAAYYIIVKYLVPLKTKNRTTLNTGSETRHRHLENKYCFENLVSCVTECLGNAT